MRPNEPISGPIEGLRLPRRAWTMLERENITTLDQLKAVANGIERVVPGIGRKMAQIIRAELVRIRFRAKPRHYQGHWARP
jgi:DNA-directed RNA polymerase alpha subunit